LILEELCPFQILFVSSRMLASVELDNKAMFHSTEIRDKRRNRMLPAEFSPCALPSTEALPELMLGVGLFVPKAPSTRDQSCHPSP